MMIPAKAEETFNEVRRILIIKTQLTSKGRHLLKFDKEYLKPVIHPSTFGGRGGWITRSRDRDHPGQHGETPSLLKKKYKKLAGHGGAGL